MVQSKAKSVDEYLSELPSDKSTVVSTVLECIRKNIQPSFAESMNWGMIAFEVPLQRFPKTYNKKPLLYCSLAAQKNHYAVYLMNAYGDSECYQWLVSGYQAAGIKLDAGKCCVRFKSLDKIHLPTIGKIVARHSVEEWIEHYKTCRAGSKAK